MIINKSAVQEVKINQKLTAFLERNVLLWNWFSIGGLQPISRDTDNNAVMYNCWWTNKRSQWEIFCFRPPTWRLWRNVKTTYCVDWSLCTIVYNFDVECFPFKLNCVCKIIVRWRTQQFSLVFQKIYRLLLFLKVNGNEFYKTSAALAKTRAPRV